MFMYAHAYALSKKLDRNLYIDNESAYSKKNSIGFYRLDNFNISGKIIEKKFKFLSLIQYLRKKYLSKLDYFKKNSLFYEERKDKNKKTYFYEDSTLKNNSNSLIYIRGHFESEKYFLNYKKLLYNEYTFKNYKQYCNNFYYKYILKNNVVAITIRQNRFNERNMSQSKNKFLQKKSDFFLKSKLTILEMLLIILKARLKILNF